MSVSLHSDSSNPSSWLYRTTFSNIARSQRETPNNYVGYFLQKFSPLRLIYHKDRQFSQYGNIVVVKIIFDPWICNIRSIYPWIFNPYPDVEMLFLFRLTFFQKKQQIIAKQIPTDEANKNGVVEDGAYAGISRSGGISGFKQSNLGSVT